MAEVMLPDVRRVLSITIVIATACTALQLSMTQQTSVVVSNDGYVFNGGGMASFTISPAGSADDDMVNDIMMEATCSSQWSVMPSESLPSRVCGMTIIVGSATDDISAGTNLCPHNVLFNVGFAGTQGGTSSCNVDITTSPTAGGSAQVTVLHVTGNGSGNQGISVAPGTIDFRDVQVGTDSTAVPITVTNNNSTTTQTVTNSQSGMAGFTVTPTTSQMIGPGLSATYSVVCHPGSTGPLAGMVSFSASPSGSGGSTTLSCNGIMSNITLNPTSVTFDPTLVGRAPLAKSVTITGPSTTMITSVAVDSEATTNGVTITTNPQGSQIGNGKVVTLAYSAAEMHASGPLGTLMITVTGEATRNVGISGEALLGGIGTNPASVDFGAVCAGGIARTNVEVYASEPGNIQVKSVTPPAAPFMATAAENLPKNLTGNHSGPSLTVNASIQATTPGDVMGEIMLVSDVPGKEMTSLPMKATVLAAGIAATPNLVHFGTVMPGTTTSIKQVQLSNCGASDLEFQGVTIVGANASDFTLIGANPSHTLNPGESETVMVVMQPHSNGLKTAQLVMQHSAGTTTADLDGTGMGGTDKERETYYACSSGQPVSALPIALALLFVRRRRK